MLLAMAMKLSKAVEHMKRTLIHCGIKAYKIKEVLKNVIQDTNVQKVIIKTVDIWHNEGAQLLDEASVSQKTKPIKYKYRYAGPVFTFNGRMYRQ